MMNNGRNSRVHDGGRSGPFLVGLYTWIVTISFGAVILDIVYANLLRDGFVSRDTAPVFAEVADFLLIIGALTVIAGAVAVGVSWTSTHARNLLIASLLIILSTLLIPPFLSRFFRGAHVAQGSGITQWLRLMMTGLPSILALIGWHRLGR